MEKEKVYFAIRMDAKIDSYFVFSCGYSKVYVRRDRFGGNRRFNKKTGVFEEAERYEVFPFVRFLENGKEEIGAREAFYHFPQIGTRERVIRPEGETNKRIYEAAKRYFRRGVSSMAKCEFELIW